MKVNWDISTKELFRLKEEGLVFFDPSLSYEKTGYRPITQTQGLDFDPVPFIEVGVRYDATKKFCTYPEQSKAFKDWWLAQHKLCIDGVEHNGYRITGDHYFFLNFYTMLKSEKDKKAGSGREEGRPQFWAAHYEFFHYIELCEVLGYDAVVLKSRGVGASEMAASLGVRPYTTTKNYASLYVAYAEGFLAAPKGILGKCWKQLDWLNQNTGGGMRRVRMGKNDDFTKKACKRDKSGEEAGHMAMVSAITVDKTSKLRGDRTDRVFFEESGANPILTETWTVAEPLVVVNGRRFGIRIAWGTGGSDGPELEGLESMFLGPEVYSVLPLRHTHTPKGDKVSTGYFIPSWVTVMDTMDHRGVADEKKAKAYYDKFRLLKKSDFKQYSKYCAEYCYYPEEALSRQGNNNFDQEKLADQYTEIMFNKSTPLVKHGYTKWDYEKVNGVATSRVNGTKFIETPNGNTHILEMPMLDENGQYIKDLYVAGIDSIDKAIGDSMEATGSKFCITIKKRTYGMEGDKYVAYYMDRPYDIREAYEKAAQLLTMYQCKANIEDTKIGIIGYYREKKWLHLLMKRPRYAIQGDQRTPPNAYGTQGTEKMILHAVDLVDAYIKDYCHLIGFIEMIEQLQNYSWEKKGKFDLVASMGMCEIGDEELMGIVPKKDDVENEVHRDIGYFYDEYGRKRYGIIPDKGGNEKLLNYALNGQHGF